MSKDNIRVIKNEESPESTELLASSIVKVADGFAKFMASGINMRALAVLLQDGIGPQNISKTQIRLVLENIPRLKAWYIKK